MKPFYLEAALAGAKVVTRDGREVKIAGYNQDAFADSKIAGWIGKQLLAWDDSGKYSETESDADLFMAPTERTEWVVMQEYYPEKYIVHGPYTEIEAAQRFAFALGGTIHEIKIIE